MRLYFKIFGNWAYPDIKFKLSKCWGYDPKVSHERKGISFTVLKNIYIVGYSFKVKPFRKGYWSSEDNVNE